MKITTLASGSSGNCYKVEASDEVFFLEAGLPFKKIMKLSEYVIPDWIFVSHHHQDHSKAAQEYADLGVKIYCSEETALNIGLKPWQFESTPTKRIGMYEGQHDCAGHRYLVYDDVSRRERLLFATDTCWIPLQAQRITHLMIETNWSEYTILEKTAHLERVMASHQSLESALEYIGKMDQRFLKEVHLIHLSNSNSDELYFREKVAGEVGVPVYIS